MSISSTLRNLAERTRAKVLAKKTKLASELASKTETTIKYAGQGMLDVTPAATAKNLLNRAKRRRQGRR